MAKQDHKDETGTLISKHYDQGDYREAIKLIKAELKNCSESHWYLTMLSSSYFELREYKKAWNYIWKAYEIMPSCPLVLWHLAGNGEALGEIEFARATWRGLLKRGVKKVAFGYCGEGMEWAKALLNDCRFRLYKSLIDENPSLAKRYLTMYRKGIMEGTGSIYGHEE